MWNELLPFIVAGVVIGSVLGLAGTGLVLTYKTSGIFNFGHGAVVAGAAYLFYFLHVDEGWPWWAAFIVVVLVMGPLFGLILAYVSRRVREQRLIWQIVATLGILLIVEGLATVKYGTDPLLVAQYLPKGGSTFKLGGTIISYAQAMIFAISVIVVTVLYCFFRFSRRGVQIRAAVDDPELVVVHGVNGAAIQRTAWMTGAVLAALSGVLIAPIAGIQVTVLTVLVTQAFGAAAVSAFGSLPLTYVGALLVGIATSVCTHYVVNSQDLRGLPNAVPFAFLIAALLFIPKRKLVQSARSEAIPKPPWTAPGSVRLGTGVLVTALLACMPVLVGTRLQFVTIGITQAIVLLSLGLLARTAGLASLCQATFAGVGAVAFAHFTNLPWPLAVLLGALVVVPVAALVALPAMRLSGIFLALATFGFALLVESVLYPTSLFFGTEGSGKAMPRPAGFDDETSFYYVVLAFFIALSVALIGLHRSRLGRTLRGLSESPLAIGTLGLNVNMTRVIVFCLAGFVAGIGGILYGASVRYAIIGDPYYGSLYSLQLVALAAITPGREPWYATVAALAAIVPGYWTSSDSQNWLNVIFGVLAVMIAMRGGPHTMPTAIRRLVEKAAIEPKRRRKPESTAPATSLEVRSVAPAGLDRRVGLEVRDLSVKYGGHTAVENVSLRAPMGQITALIGPNGAGKTSCFNAISGLLKPSSGTVHLHSKDVSHFGAAARARAGFGRTFQLMQLCDSLTVAQNIGLGLESALAGSRLRGQLFATRAETRATRAAVDSALEICRIGDLRDKQAGALSTGQRRLVELARCLAGEFDLLLLDEPSSGLDPVETQKFGSTLHEVVKERGCGILIVEHDMSLVLDISRHVYVLDAGRLLFEGSPSEVRSSPEVQAAYLGSDTSDQALVIAQERDA
ncbi:ATP-binding cassette domain-containing protein [Streptomyces sp. NPDC090088]|uniref:ABC transporter permease subunit n=1 Tax=Streptomyces sp. NPDC090088 TaxID=3365944 RepID=UPI0038303565